MQKINSLLPEIERKKPCASICMHCCYVNENNYSFCTNCGYPLQNKLLLNDYNKRIEQKTNLLFKAENSVLAARIVLYVIASFLLLGVLFIFSKYNGKYFIALLALSCSGLFFSFAFWSRKNPFTALLTSFIVLIVFSAINIFSGIAHTFTFNRITEMLLCLALLFVMLRGIQGAYKIILLKEELQFRYE